MFRPRRNQRDPDCKLDAVILALFIISILAAIFAVKARASPQVQHLDWFSESASEYIDKTEGIWAVGTSATVIDIETGLSFRACRHGGTNHIDWEPETQEDTETLKTIYGSWSWDRRPVHVIIGDEVFAGSINGKPHGKSKVDDNGCPGHFCLHFLNSKTHGSGRVDNAHQDAIEAAYAAEFGGVIE